MEILSVAAAGIIAGVGAWYITRASFMERIKAQDRMHQ